MNNNNIIFNNEIYCPYCLSIPIIEIKKNFKNPEKIFIKSNCLNGHNLIEELNEYILKSKNSFSKMRLCNECKKTSNNIYCIICKKIYCENCNNKIHIKNNNFHKIININDYNNLCLKHLKKINGCCINCNNNICSLCHNHSMKTNFNFLINDIDLNKYYKRIEDLKIFIHKLIEIKNEIIMNLNQKFNNFKNNIDNYIYLIENFVNIYDKKIKNNNLNIQCIFDIKNLSPILNLNLEVNNHNNNNLNYFMNYLNEFDFIPKVNNNNFQSSILNANCKTVISNFHFIQKIQTGLFTVPKFEDYSLNIMDILVLNDKRICTVQTNKQINFFHPIFYNIEMIINLNTNFYSITQLKKNNKLIALCVKGLYIINLLPDNKYKIEQKIEETILIYKIIEIENDLFCSLFSKKYIKFWKENNNNYVVDFIIDNNNNNRNNKNMLYLKNYNKMLICYNYNNNNEFYIEFIDLASKIKTSSNEIKINIKNSKMIFEYNNMIFILSGNIYQISIEKEKIINEYNFPIPSFNNYLQLINKDKFILSDTKGIIYLIKFTSNNQFSIIKKLSQKKPISITNIKQQINGDIIISDSLGEIKIYNKNFFKECS